MAYADFTLESAEATLGVRAHRNDLFPDLTPVPPPAWLSEALARGQWLALVSEKARSEFIVAPILLASRELSHNVVAIYSGARLDVDPARGLIGECDFLLTLSEPLPVPRLRAPLMAIVEAKRHDIDAGWGQCIAQMVAAQLYNEREQRVLPAIYGCITTGEVWQFLRLDGTAVIIDSTRRYIDNLAGILAVFHTITASAVGHGKAA